MSELKLSKLQEYLNKKVAVYFEAHGCYPDTVYLPSHLEDAGWRFQYWGKYRYLLFERLDGEVGTLFVPGTIEFAITGFDIWDESNHQSIPVTVDGVEPVCPHCQCTNVSWIGPWTSYPSLDVDAEEPEVTQEYQCRNEDCGRSFWV